MLPYIPPDAIDTPWETQEIIWRHVSHKQRTSEIQAQIDAGFTHIVREVLIRHPGYLPPEHTTLPLEAAREATDLADAEFSILASLGIVCAPTTWHSFLDHEGTTRTLARIAVVEGNPFPDQPFHKLSKTELDEVNRLSVKVNGYAYSEQPGVRLADVDRRAQYLHGQFRDPDLRSLTPEPADCLIDTEPIFWLFNSHVF